MRFKEENTFLLIVAVQENVSLIKEINDLRRELKLSRTHIHDMEAALGLHNKNKKNGGDTHALAQLAAKQPSAIMEQKLDEQVGCLLLFAFEELGSYKFWMLKYCTYCSCILYRNVIDSGLACIHKHWQHKLVFYFHFHN